MTPDESLEPRYTLSRRLAAEALGTAMLVATVVGSGIMADRLTDDVALTLLGNTLPAGAILVVLITIFGPISGAHFNPAVTLAFALRQNIPPASALAYAAAQIIGAIIGTWAAHLMFELPIVEVSTHARTGLGQWSAEIVATFGLVGTILAALRFRVDAIPWLVGLYITAAYWFTASTSFANPAVAIARSLTATFSGIRPADVPGFLAAELLGAVLAFLVFTWLSVQARARCNPGALPCSRRRTSNDQKPTCRKLRNTLGHDSAAWRGNADHRVLKTPPDRATLMDLIRPMGITLRDLLRRKGTPHDEFGLDDPKWTDDQLIDSYSRPDPHRPSDQGGAKGVRL